MKRHPALIPLSHDHHHGLLLAQLLKIDSPNFIGLPVDPNRKLEYLRKAWKMELSIHFKHEEEILIPAIHFRDIEVDSIITEILADHKKIQEAIKSLKSDTNLIGNLDKLGKLLEKHIRLEERVLFPKLQSVFPDLLEKLTGKIIAVKDLK